MSAVVVHYRGTRWLAACVASCMVAEPVVEVVVLDNEGIGARLRRAMPYREVRVLEMARNGGYGRAANAGLASARGDAVLVVNQDVRLDEGAVAAMLAVGRESGAWIVGPKLVGPDGPAPPKAGFPSPLEWEPSPAAGRGWSSVPWVSGAAMLFMPGHTDLRFDDRLFMYAEDEELCWRVWRDGGRVVLAEGATVFHEGGTATRTRWSRPAIAARTVLNRTRFVRWHAGWGSAAAYVAGAIRGAAKKRRAGPVERG